MAHVLCMLENWGKKRTLRIYNTYEIKKPTNVTISTLFIYRRISIFFGPTGPSSGGFTQLFTQPLVQWLYRSGCGLNGTATEPMVV
jgi:hypothetical protein